MASRVPLVAGNWKMNTTVPEGVELARAIAALDRPAGVDVAVLPPFPHLCPVREVIHSSGVAVGAQDCFWEAAGAFTGEVAPRMLAGICDFVLVGHSERRHVLGETDEQTARKLAAALAEGLDVMLAVGELLDERRAGEAEGVVRRQLDAALRSVDVADASRIVIAYEPVWAIGTGETASPEDAQAMCATIRHHLAHVWSQDVAATTRVLYGGSVTADNAATLFAPPDVDGGLIGGASLKIAQFAGIITAAAASPGGGGGA